MKGAAAILPLLTVCSYPFSSILSPLPTSDAPPRSPQTNIFCSPLPSYPSPHTLSKSRLAPPDCPAFWFIRRPSTEQYGGLGDWPLSQAATVRPKGINSTTSILP
ncbi:hypothetical protein LY78DRAFT_361498 [Colletotrichum sublineola]|nr:hypothetical protein LY78DRAFT_361498 [Colletotrichum sublineola]